MDARAALAELAELSSQVEAAALLDADGKAEASTPDDAATAERLASAAREALEAAGTVRSAAEVTRVEVSLPEGGLFVVREGGRAAVATTIPEATAGLVLYDLRTCLRRLDEPKPKQSRRRKTDDA
jgi:predicted regulator of Ras-like GTPase activity (Roadblock/LC7/MglB family)